MKKNYLSEMLKFSLGTLFFAVLLLFGLGASAQNTASIKGRVTDSKGITMPGVTVKLDGATAQTQATDGEGNYNFTSLRAGNYTLTITFIGFSQVTRVITLAVGQQSVNNVSLTEETTNLEEIVVVGYGTQKKTSVTASVSSIQGSAIANIPATNLSQSIAGSMTGVITRQTSGEPGKDAAQVYIRGISSIGSSSPLLIVDGIPRDYSQLDPSTIESLTILKDAAASAPYGVAGANGVILVTTKVGKTGLPTLSFSSSYGVQNPTVLPVFPTGYEYAQLRNAGAANVGAAPLFDAAALAKYLDGSDPDRYANTDAMKLIERNTPLINNNVQVSGGADKIKYYTSLGYMHQAGIFTVTYVNRFNLNLNLDAEVTNSTTLSLKLNGRQQSNNYAGEATSKIFEQLKYALPNAPLFFSNGEPATYFWPSIYRSGKTTNKTTELFAQMSVDQKLNFIPGLSAKVTIGYDPSTTFDKAWVTPQRYSTISYATTPYTFGTGIFGITKARLSQTASQSNQLTYQGSLNYNKAFGKSTVGLLVLGEAIAYNQMSITAARLNYNLDVDELSTGSSNAADIQNLGTSSDARQLGVVYRLTYDYAGKYLFEGSGRYDGHYYFAPGKRLGFFPAFSVGWRVSEENFIKNNVPFVDNLKIKASYGEVGALAGGAFQYLSTYDIVSSTYAIDGAVVQSLRERPEPNPNITWERAKKSNIGLESSFGKGLFTLDVDYFYERRSNMLTPPTLGTPLEYGVNLSQVNAGKMKNEGIEFTVGSTVKPSSNLTVSLKANVTFARNTLLQTFETAATFNNPNRRTTGRPLGTQFGYIALGYWLPEDFSSIPLPGKGNPVLKAGTPTPPQGAVWPGDLKYMDVSGDGRINQDDNVPIGKPTVPELVYGILPSVRYKGFSLDATFQGTGKRHLSMTGYGVMPFSADRGANKNNTDFWRPDNLGARFPRITPAPAANNTQTSTWWMQDVQYLRIKNAQLGYSLPSNLLGRVGIQRATFILSAQNLYTWSNLEYYDPETNTSSIGYPHEQVISLGLNVTFK